MELVELNPMRNLLVGMPGIDGLSTEQRKRLTIAVELIANPSIIFMDEPTSGLDARAAAIVMRVVRNTVDTGRTVVCTIHQPSIDIFESFDEVDSNPLEVSVNNQEFIFLVKLLPISFACSSTETNEIYAVTSDEDRRADHICWRTRSQLAEADRLF